MPRKLKAKISASTDDAARLHLETLYSSTSAAPSSLFTLNKTGLTESKRASLRRARAELTQAHEEGTARATHKRRKTEKKRSNARANSPPEARSTAYYSNSSSPAASLASSVVSSASIQPHAAVPLVMSVPNESVLFDAWAKVPTTSLSYGPPPSQLARSFCSHSSKSIIDALVASQRSLPHPGQSFNPDAESHAELLNSALEIELRLRREKEETLHALNPLAYLEESHPAVQKERKRKREQELESRENDAATKSEDEELIKEEEKMEAEESEEEGFGVIGDPKKDRLTTTQRNKRIRHLEVLKEQVRAKREKRQLIEINRLPSIVASLKSITKKRAKAKKARNELIAQQNPLEHMPRLGPHRPLDFRRSIPDVMLTEEYETTRRAMITVPTHTSAVKEAYVRLQQRRLIEPRSKQKKTRRYALKYFERNSEGKEQGKLPQYERKG